MGGGDLELKVAWQRHVGRGDAAERLFESVTTRYRGSGRHYHDLHHVRWVVRHVLELSEQADVTDLDAVVAAAFFHDAVYDVDRDDNEVRSAALAAACLGELGWSSRRCDRVASMIVATEHHADTGHADTGHIDTGDIDTDTAVLLAADLAVLAAEPAAYSDSVRKIRREYGHLDEHAWRTGRSAVVEGFLVRPSIFPPRLGLDTWERRARANLTAELAVLR
jgi:predicted metal-dependent HD superfamily phosphohydrolase